MIDNKIKFAFLLLLISVGSYAQLGFCSGSKGDPLFTENFGNGTSYGPALPAGVTTYTFVTGAPNDGQYTLSYNSNQYTTWHNSLDHTPDATNGPNGKMLLMNANAVTSGDFYKKTVTGLCVNTTFEFSAWVMNVYNPNTNYCGAGEIPINVRFEIWNATETVLLGSGNTGNIFGSPAPLWQQFALVFTTVSDTSVVLKMKNNGVGGCGNDLAIDDISFSACGDLTTVSSPSVVGSAYSTCTNPVSLTLNASTASATPYFYQWQTSTDGTTWTDITGATSSSYTTPNLTSLTYFRARAAQDPANLSNNFCSTASNVFTISVLASPNPPTSNGDKVICSGDTIPALSVGPQAATGVNWYSAATGGTLLQSNSLSYTPTGAGTFYAETYNITTNCIGSPRTPVKLTISALPTVSINANPTVSGTTYSICANSASLLLNSVVSGTPTYAYQWQSSADGTTWTDIAGATASTYNATNVTSQTYYRVKVAQDAASLNTSCSAISNIFTITVLPSPNPATSNGDKVICSGTSIPALSVTPPSGTSVNWYSAALGGTMLQGNNASYTPTAAGTYYAETYNTTTNCIASSRTPVKLTINSLPTVSINASPTVTGTTYSTCANPASLLLSAVASGAATYFYEWQSSADGTNWTDIAGATASTYNAANVTSQTYFRVKVAQDAASLNTNCSTASNIFTITVLPSPASATSNGDKVICSNVSIPALSVTPPAGTSVNWYNAATNGTLLQGNSASYTPTAAGTYYAETYNTTTNCIGNLRTPVKLTINSLPTVSINANPTVSGTTYSTCSNPASLLLNSVVSGAPTYAYQWQSSPDSTTWTNIVGANGSTYNATGVTSQTYFRVKVAQDAASLNSTCSTASNVFMITVLPSPNPATSNGDKTICAGSTVPALSVTAPAGTGVNWYSAASGGTLIQANNTSYTPTAAGTYYAETYNTTTNCMGSPRTPVKLTINALPTASVSANATSICSGQTGTFNFTGTPNAVVSYTLNGGSQTITLNNAGSASVSAPLSVGTTYQLINVSLAGCSQTSSGSASISINPAPNISYSGNLNYCEGESTAINLSSNVAGTTFSWTVTQNGTSGAVVGSGNQIAQTISLLNDAIGTVTYVVTPLHNGCSGTPKTITVTIHPLPVPQIMDGVICTTSLSPPSSQYYTLDTNLSSTGNSFQWFFGGNQITGASGNTYNANQTGVYTVIATNAAGCVSAPVNATVSEMPMGESLVIHQSAAFSDDPRITVTVVGGGGPFSYQMDDGPFQPSNVFYNVAEGTHTINVIDGYCTNLTGTATIINYPKYFTPNGDGFHDTWNISGVDNSVIWIFDRYGKLIKQINTDGLGWDGNYNGRPLPSTDYWFVIDYTENGGKKTFRAHFSLKR